MRDVKFNIDGGTGPQKVKITVYGADGKPREVPTDEIKKAIDELSKRLDESNRESEKMRNLISVARQNQPGRVESTLDGVARTSGALAGAIGAMTQAAQALRALLGF